MVYNVVYELGYLLNVYVRFLCLFYSGVIGLVVLDICNLYFVELVLVVENVCFVYGWVILLCNVDEFFD